MEPNKIEKDFREKLNAREIQPSAQAWDRLDAMLSVAEEKKTKRSFGWLYIAASVLVFVSLGLFFFNPKDTDVTVPHTVVEKEAGIKNGAFQNPVEKEAAPAIEAPVQTEAVASSEGKQPINTNHQPAINNQGVSKHNQKTNANQNQIIRDKEIQFQNPTDVALKNTPVIVSEKPIIVKNDVKVKTKSDESLLADLDKTRKQPANTKASIKVDAKSLLSQVDGEVEHTFREKMLNKISKNYQEVKVALANRNNE